MLAGRLGESGRPEAGVCPQRGGSGGGVLTGGGAPAGGPGGAYWGRVSHPECSGAMLGAGHRPDFVSRCSLCGRAFCVCDAKAEK